MNKRHTKYNRLILKISGEVLAGKKGYGIDPAEVISIAHSIKELHEHDIDVALVIGGGNIIRGAEESANTGAWMVTFSDLIMLLLTFFVLLLTMSSLDQKAVKELIAHLKNSTGVLEFSGQGEMGALASFVKSFDSADMSIMLDQDKLNKLGAQGWELVTIHHEGAEAHATHYFKRPRKTQ